MTELILYQSPESSPAPQGLDSADASCLRLKSAAESFSFQTPRPQREGSAPVTMATCACDALEWNDGHLSNSNRGGVGLSE